MLEKLLATDIAQLYWLYDSASYGSISEAEPVTSTAELEAISALIQDIVH